MRCARNSGTPRPSWADHYFCRAGHCGFRDSQGVVPKDLKPWPKRQESPVTGRLRSDLVEKLRDEAIATLAEIGRATGADVAGAQSALEDRGIFVRCRQIRRSWKNEDTLHVHRLTDRAEIRFVKSTQASALSWPTFGPGGPIYDRPTSGSTQMKLWDLEQRRNPAAAWPADVRCADVSSGRQTDRCRAAQTATLTHLRPAGHDRGNSLRARV